jgi:cobalt-zinc-cadmium resistance protein CzcA
MPAKAVHKQERNCLKRLNRIYTRVLDWAIARRAITIGSAVVLLAIALGSLFFMGAEFMPRLDEGSILIETRKLPGFHLLNRSKSANASSKCCAAFRRGHPNRRPDFATEAMGINEGDTYLILRPMNTWKRFHAKKKSRSRLPINENPRAPRDEC